MVVWADVPVGEGVEGVEEGRGALGRCETSHGEMGALWDSSAGEFERRCGSQGCHGWGWGEKEGTGQEERYMCRYSPSQVRHRVDYAFVRLVSGSSVRCSAIMSVTWLVHTRCFQFVAAAVNVDEEDEDAHDGEGAMLGVGMCTIISNTAKKNFSI
jgi:hypothetical protein